MDAPCPGPRPVAILAALAEELRPIDRALAGRRRVRAEGGSYLLGALGGRPVLLARTGVGARAARRAADWIIRTAAPRLLVAAGFAGGLREGLATGDLVLAEEVYEPPAPEGDGPREWPADLELFEAAACAAPRGQQLERGRIATARRILSTAAEKRAFGERHRALAVDMESSGIARAANVHDARALYARVVIDEVGYDLPLDLGRLLTEEGRLRVFAALAAVIRRPVALKSLADLHARARRAAEALGRYLIALVAALPPD